MRSSGDRHYIALDHVRGAAALLVFVWHFAHKGVVGAGVSDIAGAPIFPLALLDEGHTGVALFMVLSGYLFAKLLDGKRVRYPAFFYNRVLRLAPLLVVSLALSWVQLGKPLPAYLAQVTRGLVFPAFPNGAWSIATEFHFYLLLPALFVLFRRGVGAVVLAIVAMIAARAMVYAEAGTIQGLSYYTIVGRIDQFMLGMLALHCRDLLRSRHWIAGAVFMALAAFYTWFDMIGGYYRTEDSPLWIVMPTIEGAAYAVLVGWYDASFTPKNTGFSWAWGKVGEYSYSIYLLQFFYSIQAAQWIDTNIASLDSFYMAALWSLPLFGVAVLIGHFVFQVIEAPFLRLRRPYLLGDDLPVAQRADVEQVAGSAGLSVRDAEVDCASSEHGADGLIVRNPGIGGIRLGVEGND